MKLKSLLILILLTVFCVGNLFAQEQNSQCENFGKEGFVGESISLNLQNEDIRILLNKLSDEFGCNFLVEKSFKVDLITINLKKIPWNIAFETILESKGLSWKFSEATSVETNIKSKGIFISTKEIILRELEWGRNCYSNGKSSFTSSPFYTEFIKLKYLKATSSNHKNCVSCPEKDSEIINIVRKLLSDKGIVEFDKRSNSIIITDIKEKVDLIRKNLEEWDKPKTDLEKIIKDFESINKEQKLK